MVRLKSITRIKRPKAKRKPTLYKRVKRIKRSVKRKVYNTAYRVVEKMNEPKKPKVKKVKKVKKKKVKKLTSSGRLLKKAKEHNARIRKAKKRGGR